MEFVLRLNLDNAAFDDAYLPADGKAVAKILKSVAARIAEHGSLERAATGKCLDLNGNSIGLWVVVNRIAKLKVEV